MRTTESLVKNLTAWLKSTITETRDRRYRHQLLREQRAHRSEAVRELKAFVHEAHEDVRRHLRTVPGISLSPPGIPEGNTNDPALGYPEKLHINVLKEYFGEILAGLVAENFAPLGEDDWSVPAYLFRFHDAALQNLFGIRQGAREPTPLPGRLGSDCLAFQRDDDGTIKRCLVCEAKCTASHNSGMIKDAHVKLNDRAVLPVDLHQLIVVLKDYDDATSSGWVDSLTRLLLQGPDSSYERCDLASYVCGRSPTHLSRTTWISPDTPHPDYRSNRRLEAVEIHLNNVDSLVAEVYGKGEANEDEQAE